MKILLLVLAICLLAKTIKGIPLVFSKKRLSKSLSDMKEASTKFTEQTKWSKEGVTSFICVLAYIIYFVYGVIYLAYGSYIKELPILILTVVNLCQTILIDIPSMKRIIASNFESYGKLCSNRAYRFLNLLINLSFYGLCIYYLALKIIY